MKSVDEHIADVLRGIELLRPLTLQPLDAHGCILEEDVIAPFDLPPFDNSAMDGYAVRVDDVAYATEQTPAILPVTTDIPAGEVQSWMIAPGTCMRIMTGAPIPQGADAVVPVEWTDGGVAAVTIFRAPEPGQHIRRQAEDVRAGEKVLTAGIQLGAPQVGLLAAIGATRVLVRPKPRVVVVSTGSELLELGTPAQPGQIYDANSYTLAAAAIESGAIAYRVGIVPDDPTVLRDTIEDQLIRADLIVTTGGVSVGAYDVVREVLSELGTVRFDRVAMQPGMPQGFGTIGPESVPIFTLPGNPVSAYIGFEVFVRPVIRTMLGREPIHRPIIRAICTDTFRSPEGKRQYARARVDTSADPPAVRPVGAAGSHLIGNLALANALIVVPEDVTEVLTGEEVDVFVLERRAP